MRGKATYTAPPARHLGEELALSTAASVIYRTLEDVEDPDPPGDILDAVALAVSQIAPLYAKDPDTGTHRQLRPSDLIDGRFRRGATVFITREGKEFRRLTIQRGDMGAAVGILKSARVRFRRGSGAR